MPTLRECLAELRNPELALRLRLIDPARKPGAKLLMTQELLSALLGPRLREIWASLSTEAQMAVAEALYSPVRKLDPRQFKAKHGAAAVISVAPQDRREAYYCDRAPTPLGLFLYPELGTGHYCLPEDMARLLRDFVAEPPEVAIRPLPGSPSVEGGYLRETESEALIEVQLLLRLADGGGLAHGPATGIPSAAATQAMLKLLPAGDWFPPEIVLEKPDYRGAGVVGPIKAVGWTRLLMVGGLISLRGGKSILTDSGRRWSKAPPWEIIRHLREQWVRTKDFDEFNRVDLIKGQSATGVLTARQPRRALVVQALGDCPAGEWITLKEFSRHLMAQGTDLEITHKPFSLYIHDRRYGTLGYEGGHGWEILQERYLACLLMEYAATLGLVDICYRHPGSVRTSKPDWVDVKWISRYDGLHSFRITPLVAWCARKDDGTPFVPSRPQSQLQLEVRPDLTLEVLSGSPGPSDLIQIEAWAEPVGKNAWRIDPARALASVEAGQDPAEFAAYLGERDEQPLPETVQAFLKKVADDGRALHLGETARLVHCRDAATAALLADSPGSHCRRIGETLLAVPEGKLDTFRKRVRSLGLGIQ